MLSSEELQGYLTLVESTLYHKYTREASNVAADEEDDWNMEVLDWGAATVDVPCNYVSQGQLVNRDNTITTIQTPTLLVSKDDPIKVFDRITNIKDSNGTIVEVGPLYVEIKEPAMGFGSVTNYLLQLRGTNPQRW